MIQHKSALAGLLGLYKIKSESGGRSKYYLAMRDILPPKAEIPSRIYDLKGSIIGRKSQSKLVSYAE